MLVGIPFLAGDVGVFRGLALVVPFASAFGDRILRVDDGLDDLRCGQPRGISAYVLDDLRNHVHRHGGVRRGFDAVIEQTVIHVFRPQTLIVAVRVALRALPCLAHPLGDAVLAVSVSVADVEHLHVHRFLGLRRVAGQHAVHVVAAVAGIPVLRLVADQERGTSALQCERA